MGQVGASQLIVIPSKSYLKINAVNSWTKYFLLSALLTKPENLVCGIFCAYQSPMWKRVFTLKFAADFMTS